MKFSAALLAVVGCCLSATAYAQVACPRPENLIGTPMGFFEFYKEMAGPAITKGEFETTAEFEARLSEIKRPSAALVEVVLKPERFRYDADAEAFKVYIHEIDPGSAYQLAYMPKELETILGNYNYSKPVQIRTNREEADAGEYVATNAYGAETTVSESRAIEYVIFDNKGRNKLSSGDDLFTERGKYETATLSIPVPRDKAQETKSGLRMVTYVEPKMPWAAETSYRSKPTRQYPTDRRTTFRMAFADIKCVGVLNAEGELLAHWATR